jgi:hypothetical protein
MHVLANSIIIPLMTAPDFGHDTVVESAASDAVGPAFLRCEGASLSAAFRSRKIHVAHRRIKIERVYRNYLTATEAVCS